MANLFSFHIASSPSIGRLAGQLSASAGMLRTFGRRTDGSPGPLNLGMDVVQRRVAENFATESAAGDPWEQLAEATPFMGYRKRHNAANAPILDVTGRLKSAALADARWYFDGQAGMAFVPGNTFETAGQTLRYGRIQHEGGPNAGLGGGLSDIPARPFFVINEQDIQEIEGMFEEWFVSNLGLTVRGGATIETVVGTRV